MSRTCTNCANVATDDALRFCTSCGTPLPVVADDIVEPIRLPFAAPEAVEPEPVEPWEQQVNESTAAVPGTAPALDVSIVRRNRTSPFLPPRVPDEQETPVISRAWSSAQTSGSTKRQLSHERKVAGDLPEWEPLPPGELTVKRRTRH